MRWERQLPILSITNVLPISGYRQSDREVRVRRHFLQRKLTSRTVSRDPQHWMDKHPH